MIAAIFTGGASSRFGSDKALVIGPTVRDAARGAGCDPVIAVGGSAGPALGLITVPDRRPGEGPLAALASVLLWAGSRRVLVLPCDLPLLRAEHLVPLLEAAGDPSIAADTAMVAIVDDRPNQSVAIWPGTAGRTLWHAVDGGARALRVALDLVPWLGVEVDRSAFVDVDTPEELARPVGEPMFPQSTPTHDCP